MDSEKLIQIFRSMLLARRFEEKLLEIFNSGSIPGWLHSGIGQEAAGAVVGHILHRDDFLVPYHRPRSYVIAKGLEIKVLLAEIMGRNAGCCKGKGGEVHIGAPHLGIFGAGGIIGSNIPIAIGIGYAIKMRGLERVVACVFGDGTCNRGAFHEGLNMAALWSLPVIFICENNRYAEFTPADKQMKIKDIARRAANYGMPGVILDDHDVENMTIEISKGIQQARAGEGPLFIEVKNYRVRGHYEGDPLRYRPSKEVEEWQKRDPLILFRNSILENNFVTEKDIHFLEESVKKEIEEALEYVLKSPSLEMKNAVCGTYIGN